MPTYNRAKFIAETIESIQKQTYENWELIIVDDGSEDNTSKIVENMQDARIHFYKRQHLGMENARNLGLEKANGDIIGFMDSDDLWATTKLEKQTSVFHEYSEIDFCLTGGYEFKEYKKPLVFFYKQKSGLQMGDLFISFFKSELVAAPQTLLFRKHCLNIINFPQHTELGHIHFILSLSIHFKGAILYEALLFRRLHNSNYSTINYSKRHYDGIELIKHYKTELPREIFVAALLRSHINFGETCLKDKERFKAIREFFQAWKYQPLNTVPMKKIAKAILHFL